MVWTATSGAGEIYTYTVIRQNMAPPFDALRPYVVAMISLPEGPRMLANITDSTADAVTIGLPVHAYAVRVADDIGIPFWRLGRADDERIGLGDVTGSEPPTRENP